MRVFIIFLLLSGCGFQPFYIGDGLVVTDIRVTPCGESETCLEEQNKQLERATGRAEIFDSYYLGYLCFSS